MSDLLFAAAGLLGAALFFVHPPADLSAVFMPLLAGTVLGLVPIWTLLLPARPAPVAVDQVDRSAPTWSTGLKDNLVAKALARTLYNVRGYRLVWQRDSRWSVVGVIATELTVNSHAYAITILIGPAAFAPIAAAALFIRPVTVLINALNEFERARFARAIHGGNASCLLHERRTFRTTLVSAWALIFAGSLIVLLCAPQFLPHQDYDRASLFTLVFIWFAIALARCLHTPDGALLQAQGQFRMLAGISIWTALLSVVAVTAGLWLFGPVWSLVGILAGEGAYAAVLLKRGYRLTRQLTQNSSEEGE